MQTAWLRAIATAILFTCLTNVISAADSANQLTEPERKAGWKLLFDGQSTEGWRNYKKDGISDGWKVVDGALTLVDKGAGDIITARQYDRFELSIDYRISPGGNSGLMFHVTEDARTAAWSAPEIQIQDNKDGHDPQKSGWLYQLYQAAEDATRPAGQWNTIQLRMSPDESVLYMNGVRYYRFKKGNQDWKNLVAKSKFADTAGWGKATKGHIALQDHGNEVAYRNIKIRELTPGAAAYDPVDGMLPLKAGLAFPQLKWADWEPVDDRGRPTAFRPIALTHAGDGSNRVFVATQRGVIHVFPNDQAASQSKVFLDIQSKVVYNDQKNEEGFLGLAFHPDYERTGELFAYYTTTDEPQTSVISRFRVSPDDPNKALADSEAEIMRIKQPYWNHNGGTIAFGPDGMLYVALGDGGSGNDPHGNGQNLSTLLGSILRIDVDEKTGDRAYGIPKDNPFVGRSEARGEIWANGIRNVWRLAFDPETKLLWAADVGQNLWEEINIIERGGNYGWNLREAAHTFGTKGGGAKADLIDPIWEYDHEIGKSITGGFVYRGTRLPELVGYYLYADYVSGRLWALKYDHEAGQVIANMGIPSKTTNQVISYGEDEEGEVYFVLVSPTGRGIYRFERE
jgi:glucose/arabinose dehydrogenase